MFKHICFFAISCLLLAHCAGTVKIMPEYKNINVEQYRLGIVLFTGNMQIKNPNDITRYLGDGETKEVFYGFFTSKLEELTKERSRFDDVGIVNGCDTSGFTKSTLFLFADDSVQVRIPPKMACMDDSVPFLLILDYFDVSREQNPGRMVVNMGPLGSIRTSKVGAYDNLIVKATFVIWDNVAGKIVSFGKINEKTDVLPSLTKQSWTTAVESISSKIFVDTPYGMPSVLKAE